MRKKWKIRQIFKVQWIVLSLFVVILTAVIIPLNTRVISAAPQSTLTKEQSVVFDQSVLAVIVVAAISIVTIVFLISYAWVAVNGLNNAPNEIVKWFISFVTSENSNALQIFTVVSVLCCLVFLALVGQLTEGAIAILSSISGYVLGSRKSSEKISRNDVIQKNPEKPNDSDD